MGGARGRHSNYTYYGFYTAGQVVKIPNPSPNPNPKLNPTPNPNANQVVQIRAPLLNLLDGRGDKVGLNAEHEDPGERYVPKVYIP